MKVVARNRRLDGERTSARLRVWFDLCALSSRAFEHVAEVVAFHRQNECGIAAAPPARGRLPVERSALDEKLAQLRALRPSAIGVVERLVDELIREERERTGT